jgi:hypothetical protein
MEEINWKKYYDSKTLSNKLDEVIISESKILKQNLLRKKNNTSSIVSHV